MSPWLVLSALSLAAWVFLWLGRNGYWRADQRLPPALPDGNEAAAVVAIVPARNEADTIADCLTALSQQRYAGDFRIVLVDDDSDDGTGEIARRTAGAGGDGHAIEVIGAPALQSGWTGKLWALNAGLDHVNEQARQPDFIWLTDADIVHGPDTLSRLVAKARADDCALVSLMVRLSARRFWERWIIPAFVYFFQLLYPFAAVNDPNSRTAGAAGGCILVRKHALDRIGGFARIRDCIIDDCALAAVVKGAGHRIWLGLADDSHSCRPYGFGDLWRMVVRTAFTQLGYSPAGLAGTVAGLALIFLVPPAAALFLPWHGDTAAAPVGLLAWLTMAGLYWPTLAYYDRPRWEGLALPVVAVLYTAMTVGSALAHWRGRTGQWKGRLYGGEDHQGVKNR